jgi:L-amino acid N-acyltransferase YncA
VPTTKSNCIVVRNCLEADMTAIAGIHGHHVRTGTASFEIEPPTLEEMSRRRYDIMAKGLPYPVTECETRALRQMITVVGDSANLASIRPHERHGFQMAGVLRSVGYKHGRWLDSVLLQRPLGEGDIAPPVQS